VNERISCIRLVTRVARATLACASRGALRLIAHARNQHALRDAPSFLPSAHQQMASLRMKYGSRMVGEKQRQHERRKKKASIKDMT